MAQLRIAPAIRLGYMNHLTHNGINAEFGADGEIPKGIHISTSFWTSTLDANTLNEVSVRGISVFFTYPIMDRGRHQSSIRSGLTVGTYQRFTDRLGFEKEYEGLA